MNNKTRVILGGIVAALIATVLYLVVPGKTGVLHIAYGATLLAITLLAIAALTLTRDKVRIPQDFVFTLDAWSYFGGSLLISVVGVILDKSGIWAVPLSYFCAAQLLLLGYFVLRLLLLSAGKSHIDCVEDVVKEKRSGWHLLVADIDAIQNRLPDSLSNRKRVAGEISAVYEAFRYSDPVSNPTLVEFEASLKKGISELGLAVDGGRGEEVAAICSELLRRLDDRNSRVKILK
jgi:hypothetical protein